MTQHEIESLFTEWDHDTIGQSICTLREPAAEKLYALGAEIVPYLLARLRDFSPSMQYQTMLTFVTKEDIWVGDRITGNMRAYNVRESADKWLAWGKEKGFLKEIPWIVSRGNDRYGLCWKCLKNDTEFTRTKTETGYHIEITCPICGIIRQSDL